MFFAVVIKLRCALYSACKMIQNRVFFISRRVNSYFKQAIQCAVAIRSISRTVCTNKKIAAAIETQLSFNLPRFLHAFHTLVRIGANTGNGCSLSSTFVPCNIHHFWIHSDNESGLLMVSVSVDHCVFHTSQRRVTFSLHSQKLFNKVSSKKKQD